MKYSQRRDRSSKINMLAGVGGDHDRKFTPALDGGVGDVGVGSGYLEGQDSQTLMDIAAPGSLIGAEPVVNRYPNERV